MTRWATFDCYGTLIDWERGITDTFAGLWPAADPRALLATYHDIEPSLQRGSAASYRDVLTDALRGVARAHALAIDENRANALAASLPEWPPFAEVPDALSEVRSRGWKLAILSNTDPDLLDASIKRIGVEIDVRITVAEAGSYKPAHGHWDAFFAATDADPSGHAHVAASLFHDVAPCTAMGLRVVWVNRKDETADVEPSAVLTDLRALPDTLDELVEA